MARQHRVKVSIPLKTNDIVSGWGDLSCGMKWPQARCTQVIHVISGAFGS